MVRYAPLSCCIVQFSLIWHYKILDRVSVVRVVRSSTACSWRQLHNDRKMCVSCLFSLVAWFGPVWFGLRQTYVALIVHVAQKQLVFNKFYCCSTHKQQLQQQQKGEINEMKNYTQNIFHYVIFKHAERMKEPGKGRGSGGRLWYMR